MIASPAKPLLLLACAVVLLALTTALTLTLAQERASAAWRATVADWEDQIPHQST